MKTKWLRTKVKKGRWQDWVNLIVGIWLFSSPMIFGYRGNEYVWNSYVFGGGVILFSVWALTDRKIWEEWINLIIGIWIIISPWVLDFAIDVDVLWNTIIIGIAISTLSIWSLSYKTPSTTT